MSAAEPKRTVPAEPHEASSDEHSTKTIDRPRPSSWFTPHLTITRLFVATIVGVTFLVAGLFAIFIESSRKAMLGSARLLGDSAAMRIDGEVHAELHQAAHTIRNVERTLQSGLVEATPAPALEALLITELLDDEQVAEVTFTHTDDAHLRTSGPWQLSAFRSSDAASVLIRRVALVDGRFEAEVYEHPLAAGSAGSATRLSTTATQDPTTEPGFRDAAALPRGQTTYGDLVYAERDAGLVTERRRVVQTVQQAVEDRDGSFVGVVSVQLLARTVDAVSQVKVNAADPLDPHRVFLCDSRGGLITRLSKEDHFVPTDGALAAADCRCAEQPAPQASRAERS